jgi:hypothetical protein
MSAPDLTTPIRAAIVADASVTSLLPAYQGSFPVFTRRPVPDLAPYPMIVISKDITVSDEDGVNDDRPAIVRDVAVYGMNEPAERYHELDVIARAIRGMFHRKSPLTLSDGWTVTLITATGPTDFRLENDKQTGRVVQLTVRVARLR